LTVIEGFKIIVQGYEMRKTTLLILTACIVIFSGCSDNARTPTDTGVVPDDGNNNGGNNGGTTEYGDLYFTSGSGTSWLTGGPVTIEYGNILAVNDTDVEMQGSALLLQPINFDRSTHLTFIWVAEVHGSASYSFYAADSPDNMQSIPFREGSGGRMVAQLDLFMSVQIYCTFLFVLPPQSRVRLSDIRGYGI